MLLWASLGLIITRVAHTCIVQKIAHPSCKNHSILEQKWLLRMHGSLPSSIMWKESRVWLFGACIGTINTGWLSTQIIQNSCCHEKIGYSQVPGIFYCPHAWNVHAGHIPEKAISNLKIHCFIQYCSQRTYSQARNKMILPFSLIIPSCYHGIMGYSQIPRNTRLTS